MNPQDTSPQSPRAAEESRTAAADGAAAPARTATVRLSTAPPPGPGLTPRPPGTHDAPGASGAADTTVTATRRGDGTKTARLVVPTSAVPTPHTPPRGSIELATSNVSTEPARAEGPVSHVGLLPPSKTRALPSSPDLAPPSAGAAADGKPAGGGAAFDPRMSATATNLRREMIEDAQVKEFVAAASMPGRPRENASYTPEHLRQERAIAQKMMARAGQADSPASDGARNASFQGSPVAPPTRMNTPPRPPLVEVRESPMPPGGSSAPTSRPWSAALAEPPSALPPSSAPVVGPKGSTTVDLRLPMRGNVAARIFGGAVVCALLLWVAWGSVMRSTMAPVAGGQTGTAGVSPNLPAPPPPDPPATRSADDEPKVTAERAPELPTPPQPRAAAHKEAAPASPPPPSKRPHEDFASVAPFVPTGAAGAVAAPRPAAAAATPPVTPRTTPAASGSSSRPHLKNKFPLEEF